MSHKILVSLSSFAKEDRAPLTLLEQSGVDFYLNPNGKRFDMGELVQAAQGCIGVVAGLERYEDEVFSQLPNLKCISRCGVGIDSINLKAAEKHGVTVFNTPDVVIQPVAELTLTLVLDLLKKVSQQSSMMHQHQWVRLSGFNLKGKTVGLLGLGRIGKRVAELFRSLDVNVIGVDLYPDQKWAHQYDVAIMSLEDVLNRADIVSIHMTHVENNPFLMKQNHFNMMKKGSMLVNVARSSFVDEHDLIIALKKGHLSAAAIDVYEQEPYDGPLCDMENVVLTPHIATQTMESRVQMECEAVQNLLTFLKC